MPRTAKIRINADDMSRIENAANMVAGMVKDRMVSLFAANGGNVQPATPARRGRPPGTGNGNGNGNQSQNGEKRTQVYYYLVDGKPTTDLDAATTRQIKDDFKAYAGSNDLNPAWMGKTVLDKRTKYTLIGLMPQRGSSPVVLEDNHAKIRLASLDWTKGMFGAISDEAPKRGRQAAASASGTARRSRPKLNPPIQTPTKRARNTGGRSKKK
jgi:hypothetical protein